ncbi:MAG: hypothetical protein GC192_09330 [Bacteroidetes bacterium]|nr:hypothetical protein [Bacteroidota bacterium]
MGTNNWKKRNLGNIYKVEIAKRLKEIYKNVSANLNLYDLEKIHGLLSSKMSEKRLEGLYAVRLIELFQDVTIFEKAKTIIEDKNNDCRWQALIVCSEFMERFSDEVWDIILNYGNSEDDDMRSAIATVLLEHYFENNLELKLHKLEDLERKVTYDEYANLKKTLSMCWSTALAVKFPALVKYSAAKEE